MSQIITIISVAALVGIDQLIKLAVVKYLEPVGSVQLIKGFVQLNYAENTGAAFGSFGRFTNILSVITFLAIAVIVFLLLTKRIKFGVEYVCWTVIISGGIGNLADRIIRGFVVDYIEPLFVDFAIFNFADILVTCGAAVLICKLIYDAVTELKKGKGTKNE